jgi:hypothetical protein
MTTRPPPYVVLGASAVSEPLWMNADDRLPGVSLGRVEGGDSNVEGRDVADVGPQSSVSRPLDDLTQVQRSSVEPCDKQRTVLGQGLVYVGGRQTVAARAHRQMRSAHILGLDRQPSLGDRDRIGR